MFLLDANVVSELREFGTARLDPRVAAWFSSVAEEDCYVSAVTLFELEVGVRRKERSDPRQGAAIRAWMQRLEVQLSKRTLSLDTEVARLAATLHVVDPAPLLDSLIGATALSLGLRVVTRNTRDFLRFGVPVVDPWEV